MRGEEKLALFDENVINLPGARRSLRLMFAVSAADGLLIAGQALGVAQAITGVWNGAGLHAQFGWIALFLGCLLLRQAIDYARSRHLDRFSRDHARALREQLLSSVYDQGARAVSAHGSASLATSIIEGVNQVQVYLTLHLSRTADLLAIPCVLTIVLACIDPISGVIAVVILPCIFFYMRLLGTMAKETAAAKLGTFQRMANHFADTLRGMQTIKAFGRGPAVAQSIFSTSEEFRHATIGTIRTATLSSLVLDLFRVFALAAVAIMLGFRLMAGGIALMPALCVLVIVPELFAAVRRYSTDFHATLDGKKQLQAILALLQEGEGAADEAGAACAGEGAGEDADAGAAGAGEGAGEDADAGAADTAGAACAARVGEGAGEDAGAGAADAACAACATCVGEEAGEEAADVAGEANAPSTHNLHDSTLPHATATAAATAQDQLVLTLSDVAFSYQDNHQALQGISFTTTRPAKVGIVGASGAGKSTLARMLAGFSHPTSGNITLNGQPLASLDCAAWQQRTTYIPQHPHLFQGSLRDNIAFYRPAASDREIRQAAQCAGLDSLINALPQGLDTRVGEKGRGLSGGQAQRVALARAFLCQDRTVVVYDEPTAHLDIETELALKQHMLSLMEGRLTFFATHRLHWMRDMDLILVLDQGKLVQSGSFEQLTAQPGPFLQLAKSLRGETPHEAPEALAKPLHGAARQGETAPAEAPRGTSAHEPLQSETPQGGEQA